MYENREVQFDRNLLILAAGFNLTLLLDCQIGYRNPTGDKYIWNAFLAEISSNKLCLRLALFELTKITITIRYFI